MFSTGIIIALICAILSTGVWAVFRAKKAASALREDFFNHTKSSVKDKLEKLLDFNEELLNKLEAIDNEEYRDHLNKKLSKSIRVIADAYSMIDEITATKKLVAIELNVIESHGDRLNDIEQQIKLYARNIVRINKFLNKLQSRQILWYEKLKIKEKEFNSLIHTYKNIKWQEFDGKFRISIINLMDEYEKKVREIEHRVKKTVDVEFDQRVLYYYHEKIDRIFSEVESKEREIKTAKAQATKFHNDAFRHIISETWTISNNTESPRIRRAMNYLRYRLNRIAADYNSPYPNWIVIQENISDTMKAYTEYK